MYACKCYKILGTDNNRFCVTASCLLAVSEVSVSYVSRALNKYDCVTRYL